MLHASLKPEKVIQDVNTSNDFKSFGSLKDKGVFVLTLSLKLR